MPKSETPALIPRDSHIRGNMPVLMASFGVNCADGGRILTQTPAPFLLSDHFTGSTSAGHQFFGGSRKSIPHTAQTISMYTPTRSRTQT